MKENKKITQNELNILEKRINIIMGYLKQKDPEAFKNQTTSSKKLNVERSNLSALLNGDSRYLRVDSTIINNIFNQYTELNKEWFETGEGEMLLDDSATQKARKVYDSEIITPRDGLKKPIPYYNVDFAGGWESEEIFSIGNPDFYISNPEFSRSEFACNLVGHSISRRVPNRSIIGLRLIDDWQTYFPTNELYAIVMKNELRTVKIVKRSKEDKKTLILLPDPLSEYNQIPFEPEEVSIEFISKFYQIVAWAFFEILAY